MSSDERLPDVVHQTPSAVEVPVATHEGEYIQTFIGKVPAITLEMPVGYMRGTHLKFEVEVRVRGVSYDEDRKGNLFAEHKLALEEVKLIGAYTAEQLDPGTGGSASVAAAGEDDEDEQHEEGSDERPDEAATEEDTDDVGF